MCNWIFYNYQLHVSFLNKYVNFITLFIYYMIDMLFKRYSNFFPTIDNKRKFEKIYLLYDFLYF